MYEHMCLFQSTEAELFEVRHILNLKHQSWVCPNIKSYSAQKKSEMVRQFDFLNNKNNCDSKVFMRAFSVISENWGRLGACQFCLL